MKSEKEIRKRIVWANKQIEYCHKLFKEHYGENVPYDAASETVINGFNATVRNLEWVLG
jgi:hypothetical protein